MNDEFWLAAVRKCGSNSATSGFADLEDLINSGRLTVRELRSLHGALRALSQQAWDRAASDEAKARRPREYQTKTETA